MGKGAWRPACGYVAQRVTEKVNVRWNWNACTTIAKGQQYFAKVLTDGPISRINFSTIADRGIGAEMPRYGIYDDTFRTELKPYIDNLNTAHGLIHCPKAWTLAKKLMEENRKQSILTQDRVFENLSFRANVIAYLKACVLYVANGCQWEQSITEFIRWSVRYDLWCKMQFFGAAIAAEETNQQRQNRRGPANLLAMLNETFTFADAAGVRVRTGKDYDGTARMLKVWKSRKYIQKMDEQTYKKLL